ncbi:MAG: 3-phenylpropionate MFS transporter [Rhodospirillaceae bacterium]
MSFRLAFYYSAAFAVIGVIMPFWPLWLKAHGLSAEDLALVMALGIAVKTLANPLVAGAADRLGERKRLISGLCFIAILVFSLFHWTYGFWPILAVTLLFHAFWSPNMPLMESLVMQTAKQQPIDYGRVRLWGSLTFIAGAWAMGKALDGGEIDNVYWVVLGLMAVTLLSALTLPDTRIAPAVATRRPILEVATDRAFLGFLVATALIQASHAVYYTFGTIHWLAAGHSEAVIGWLWAEGVIAEVILFVWGDKLVRRFGAARLIALGGLAGLVRWAATGMTDGLPALLVLQILHAFTFGAAHLGAVHFIARRMAPEVSATAQSLYAAVVMGLALGLAAWMSGKLYAAYAGEAYFAMALMSGLGAVVAYALRRRN